jgi:hypothetical protein
VAQKGLAVALLENMCELKPGWDNGFAMPDHQKGTSLTSGANNNAGSNLCFMIQHLSSTCK